MNLQQFILTSIRKAAAHVFATMLGMELTAAHEDVETGTPDSTGGVVSFIGVAGAWAGTGSLTCSPDLACRVSSRMLAADIRHINEDVLDAIAELTNIIIGSVKTDLEHRVGPLGLSIPTVVYGRNFHTRSASASQWSVVRFPVDADELMVRLCLAPLDPRIVEPGAPYAVHRLEEKERNYAFGKIDS